MINSVARVLPALVGVRMTAERPDKQARVTDAQLSWPNFDRKLPLFSAGAHCSRGRPDAGGRRMRAEFSIFLAQMRRNDIT